MSLSIGERLKSARKEKGKGLEEVARATKIQRNILEAIEENRVEELLDAVYSKIFLKKYAAFLGLDGAALMEEYLALHGSTLENQANLQPPESSSLAPAVGFREVLLPAAIGLMAFIGLVFIGYLSLNLYKNLSHLPKVSAPRPVPPRAAARPPIEKKEEGPKLLIPRSHPLKLTVHTRAEVWMQVKADGAVIFQNVLPKGAQESWTAKEELELWTGNAGAMELDLNGKPLSSPGSGVKKGIRVTHRGLEPRE